MNFLGATNGVISLNNPFKQFGRQRLPAGADLAHRLVQQLQALDLQHYAADNGDDGNQQRGQGDQVGREVVQYAHGSLCRRILKDSILPFRENARIVTATPALPRCNRRG